MPLTEVTDPNILAAFSGGRQEVTDPSVLAAFNSSPTSEDTNFMLNAAKLPPTPKPVSKFESAIRGIGQGVTLGFGDEIGGALHNAGLQQQGTEDIRQGNSAAQSANPMTYGAGEIGGAVGGALALPALAPFRGASIAARAGNAAVEGGLLSGAYGAGTAEGGVADRVVPALKSGAIGAVTGGALGAATGKLASSSVQKALEAETPATAAIRQKARVAYQAADDAGLVVKPQIFDNFAKYLPARLKAEGFHPKIQDKTAGALDAITSEMGAPKSLQDLDNLRKIASSAAKSVEPEERRTASILIDHIDNFMENLKPSDVAAGDVKAGMAALKEARANWAVYRKADKIDALMTAAQERASQFSGSGLENAITTEFRAFVKNTKNRRGFTDAEWSALQMVGRGTPITKVLRQLGKFAPTGVVSTVLSGSAGGALGGGVGAVALPAAGFVARQAATRATQGAARRASTLVRSAASPASESALSLPALNKPSGLLRGGSLIPSVVWDGLSGPRK